MSYSYVGTSEADLIQAPNVPSNISGGAGNDTISGGAGADVLVGGEGVDWLSYAGSNAGVSVNLGSGLPGIGGHAQDDTFTGFEAILGSSFADTLIGVFGDTTLEGGSGNDILAGDVGNDSLVGGEGADTLIDIGGNNTLEGGGGDDSLTGGGSADTLAGGEGDDFVEGGSGNDILAGGDGLDQLSYAGSNASVSVNLATGVVIGGDAQGDTVSGFEAVLGSSFADMLTGDSGNNALDGGYGNDILTGGEGNDTIDGGAGADVALFTGPQAAYRFGLDGNILLVSGPDGTDRLSNIEALSFDGVPAVSVDSLQDSGQIEELVSIQNNGTTTKLLPDVYSGPVAWLEYAVLGSNTTDVAIGTSQNDFFNLLGGDDAANGGAGDDVIDGGTGSNFLTGGAGRDDFFLDGRGGSTTWATITDWEAGERLSVWGWRPGVSEVLWVDSAGAPGWTGVTMHGDLDGNGVIDTSVTWTGLTRDQLPTPLQFDGLLWFV